VAATIDSSAFVHFDSPGPVKHGLPGIAYTSEKFFQLEQQQIFSNHWVFVAFAHELASPGDVQPVQLAGLPLFLLRAEDGTIKAFHNVCRHRNLKLIDQPGNCGKLIRCPYHSWSYDLCGKLKNAPFFGGRQQQPVDRFKFEEHGLLSVACETWHDWVFVNLARKPIAFDAHIDPIKRLLGGNDVTQYHPVVTVELGEVACNWKLLMENFIEPYHVQFVHQTTTSQPLKDHYTVADAHCLGSAVDLDDEQEANAKVGTLGVTSRYLTLFPSFVLGTYKPDQVGVHLNIPVSAAITRQRRVIYTHRDANYSNEQIRQMHDLWYSVHREDHAMCERLQQGRRSPLADTGGVLSPYWETSVRKFQQLVADAVLPALGST